MAGGRRGRPPKSGGISRTSIFSAAMALMEQAGPEAVTFRALARECGVTPMSIAYHVGNRDGLLKELAEIAFAGIELPQEGPPVAQLRTLLAAYADKALAHPALVRMLLADPDLMPDILAAVTERMLSLIAEAGHQADAEGLVSLLVDYTHGFVFSAAAAPPGYSLTLDTLMVPVDWVLGQLERAES